MSYLNHGADSPENQHSLESDDACTPDHSSQLLSSDTPLATRGSPKGCILGKPEDAGEVVTPRPTKAVQSVYLNREKFLQEQKVDPTLAAAWMLSTDSTNREFRVTDGLLFLIIQNGTEQLCIPPPHIEQRYSKRLIETPGPDIWAEGRRDYVS